MGVSAEDVHEVRVLRDAEAADPGVIERSIGELVADGEEPTKAALARKIDAAPKKPPKPAAILIAFGGPIEG